MQLPPWSTPLEEWQFLLARQLHGVFDPEAWEARDGMLRFRGRLLVDPEQAFTVLSDRLRPLGYTPQLLRPDEIALLRFAPAGRGSRARGWAIPAALFIATVLSTFLVNGLAYSACIMGILLVHELGHYLTARYYGMRVSLPYFIPMPVSLLGTMGAIIRMRSPLPNRRVLFDVGIAGPLAGLAVAIPVTIVGLYLSKVVPHVPDSMPGVLQFGEPLLFRALARLVIGPLGSEETILVHPVGFAGWLGFFVTALNLIPAGQLDGGHIGYAVLGRRHDKVALLTVLGLFGMALYSSSRGQLQVIWAVWGSLLLILGYRHPPPLNDLTPLDPVRHTIGILSWGLFLALITPVPFIL